MHELAITCSIVELVEEAAQGRKVRRVTLEIGRLSGVVPEAIAFCFLEIARGTLAEDAILDIRQIDATARCEACGGEFAMPSALTVCPCGSLSFRRITGDELNIKSIEVEEVFDVHEMRLRRKQRDDDAQSADGRLEAHLGGS
jgi:hydrogenase nickel incorporation protein HypA/HybF